MANGVQYWARRLSAIKAEGISTKAYAEREGLAVGSLYEWRRRLNQAKRKPSGLQRRRDFVAVRVQQQKAKGARLEFAEHSATLLRFRLPGDKPDRPLARLRRRHQLPNGIEDAGDGLIVGLEFPLQLLELGRQGRRAEKRSAFRGMAGTARVG